MPTPAGARAWLSRQGDRRRVCMVGSAGNVLLTADAVKRKSLPSIHMRCSTTASLRASVTLARFKPRRCASLIAQLLRLDHLPIVRKQAPDTRKNLCPSSGRMRCSGATDYRTRRGRIEIDRLIRPYTRVHAERAYRLLRISSETGTKLCTPMECNKLAPKALNQRCAIPTSIKRPHASDVPSRSITGISPLRVAMTGLPQKRYSTILSEGFHLRNKWEDSTHRTYARSQSRYLQHQRI